MNMQMTLEESDVDVRIFDDTADQVTGWDYSVRGFGSYTSLSTQTASDWFAEANRQFRAIERLQRGWDSQGGAPPNRETVQSGAALLRTLVRADADVTKPGIHPTRSGGIQFHWESGTRYFEIEILDPRTARFYYVDNDVHAETEGNLQVGDSVEQILRLLGAVERGQ